MTRSKIKFNGKFYKVVPWINAGECDGCCFFKNKDKLMDCPNNASQHQFCDDGGEFSGKVFIEHGKEGLAEYIATKLEGSNES